MRWRVADKKTKAAQCFRMLENYSDRDVESCTNLVLKLFDAGNIDKLAKMRA
jgi:hypothetical protein